MAFFPGQWLIHNIRVGQAQKDHTGCTVLFSDDPNGYVTGVNVGGGAPGTRETDALASGNLVGRANAILLTGGSSFGLAAADGVMKYLLERNFGFPTEFARVPIVPAAVIYDLGLTTTVNPPAPQPYFPHASLGYQACLNLTTHPKEGNVGVGAGATVGKILGMDFAMKTGVGISSGRYTGIDGKVYTVSVIVVVNALGDIITCKKILAGAYNRSREKFLNTTRIIIGEPPSLSSECSSHPSPNSSSSENPGNTTLMVIATDFPLDNVSANRAARVGQDSFAIAIQPVHTSFDGDTIFVMSTQQACQVDPTALTQFITMANQVAINAIERSATQARPLKQYPSYQSIYPHH